jgi:hypothetical protein
MESPPGSGRARLRLRTRVPIVVVSIAAVISSLALSDRRRAHTDPLEECADYAAALRRCFGERTSITAPPPPRTEAERKAARKRGLADRAHIERVPLTPTS